MDVLLFYARLEKYFLFFYLTSRCIPAHSNRQGDNENLVINTLFINTLPSHFLPNSEAYISEAYWVAELNAALCLLTKTKNKNIKYFIAPSGNRTHNRRVYSHSIVPTGHDGLKIKLISCCFVAALNAATQLAMPPEFGRKSGT